MPDYQELLERGAKKIPKDVQSGERFTIPKARVSVSGSKTIIENFYEIISFLRRDSDHVLKFMLKELATKGEVSGQRVSFQGVFSPEIINKKIGLYVKNYVLCRECGKPDTKLTKEKKITYMKCEACGAGHPITKIIRG